MARPLDPNQLGKKGQDRFSELCVDGGLVPNEVRWDRKGWDFAVDWRHDASETAYDTRPTLPSCLVQVKAIWAGGRKIRLPLLAAEHLAKDLKPAFLCVLEVGDDLAVHALHLAHFEGEFLAYILKALRKARAESIPLARVNLEPSLGKWFHPVAPVGSALRAALEAAIGPSLADRAAVKQSQIKELGFEGGGREMTFRMIASEEKHFAEAILGMRQIDVRDASAREVRFGIAIADPDFPAGTGKIEFTPQPEGECRIAISSASLGTLDYKSEIYTLPAPMVEAGLLYLRLKTQLFTMLFSFKNDSESGKGKTSFDLRTDGKAIECACQTAFKRDPRSASKRDPNGDR